MRRGRLPSRRWEALRHQALERDDWRCVSCRRRVSIGRKGGVQAEVHHVLPVAAGGANELANLETRCRDCHLGAHKRRLTPVEAAWQRFIAELQ